MIWKENRLILGILGVLFAANVFFFFTYRVQYQSRLEEAAQRQTDAENDLAKARGTRVSYERQLASYFKVQHELDKLYNERWSTQTQRLTSLILEVKRLNAATKMEPATYTFTGGEMKEPTTGQERARPGSIGTKTVSIVFTVQGDYQQVRRLINLLELSEQFVIIDSIQLAGSAADPKLTLNLRLKTLFRDPNGAPTAAAG
jgi:hypothetical protein